MERIEVDATVALAAVGGLLVGGAAAGGMAYLLLRKSFQSRLDAEVATVKTQYNDRLKAALSNSIHAMPEAGVPFVGRPDDSFNLAGDPGHRELWDAALGNPPEVAERRVIDPLEGLDDGEEEPDSGDAQDDSEEGAPAPVTRDLRRPYVISAMEFADSPPGWQQLTIKYFDADGTLVDDKDEPVPNFQKIVGPIKSLDDFGGMSGDPYIRYVRNQDMETDFEILFDPRSYADGVLNYGQPNRGS